MNVFGIDFIDGCIIGEVSHRAAIYSPHGLQYSFWYGPGEDPQQIATNWIAAKKSELGREFDRLWPAGLELRIYD